MRLLAAFIAMLIASAQIASATLTNESVVKMCNEDLGEDVIIMIIDKGDNNFDTSADALIELKKNDVPENVIKAMIGGTSKHSSSTVSAPAKAAKDYKADDEIDIPDPIVPEIGKEYYTRFSFFFERGAYVTTNYARGSLVSVNTKVKLVSLGKDSMTLQPCEGGESIKVKNVQDYSCKTMDEFARLMLAGEKTDIDDFSDDMAASIRSGELRLGMTKQQAILARGYPPAHVTPSTESNTWVYWSSRFVKLTIVFENGVLTQGRGLH